MKKTILITAAGLISVTSSHAQVASTYENISPMEFLNGGFADVNLSSNTASLFHAQNNGSYEIYAHNRDFAIDVWSGGHIIQSDYNEDWSWSSAVIGLGDTVDANTSFHAGGSSYTSVGSLWSNGTPVGTNAYVGTRRVDGANTYYGYVQLQLVSVPPTNAFYDSEWAFVGIANETTTDTPITVTPITPVPEPSSTALLGLGAIGLLTRRKR